MAERYSEPERAHRLSAPAGLTARVPAAASGGGDAVRSRQRSVSDLVRRMPIDATELAVDREALHALQAPFGGFEESGCGGTNVLGQAVSEPVIFSVDK